MSQKISFGFVGALLAIASCSGQRDNRKAPTQVAGADAAGFGGTSGATGGTSTGGTDDEGGATGTGAEPAGRAGSASGASGSAGVGGLGGSSGLASFGGVSGIGGSGGAGTAGSLGKAGFSGSAGMAGTAGQSPQQPVGWLCLRSYYADGVCDCGCAAPDADCGDEPTIATCHRCSGDSCSPYNCPGNIDPSDITRCTQPPPSWTCADPLWDDGSICDCGCGYLDPDCSSVSSEACDSCNEPGSCSVPACPGTIRPDMNSVCHLLPEPPGWTCEGYGYGDGEFCHCGCGAPDLDCVTGDLAECDSCSSCGGGTCAQEVDPDDTTQCLPPPTGWICHESIYRDSPGDCDCGCGVFDPDCEEVTASWCGFCPPEGCTGGDCRFLDQDNNALCMSVPSGWTCDPLYYDDFDDACDCGCGVLDADCATANRSSCDICDSEGSCSTTPCPGTIASADNATCGS